MPDYGEILAFLAANPPHLEAERELHASLLELLAHCLRAQGEESEAPHPDASFEVDDEPEDDTDLLSALANRHMRSSRIH